ncbi:copper resistance protein NlpE N-terminal domain-containing protein [Flavobacterium sp. 245]|uniref:copper resistance protein NlpE N-terminal domain-containing protein n=1 Tax=Flavobacterium sp. 245 TaxID=2512115 RepID=UPI00105E646A|nr:copper resistance protein NlpE N-terminal domain-containing protein [Flavobacterium sp. 245]TDP01565.1 NlpE-like protein [Flavobacterium sp. 245]
MKQLIIALFLISNLTLLAQTSQFAGNYNRILSDGEKHKIEYTLTLNPDGTFVFHSHSKLQGGVPAETDQYGKGKWSAKGDLITFYSNKQEDFDEKYTLDFNKSTARFITKNPRDKSDKIVKTKLQFLESEIFWMSRIDIFKE